MKSEEAIEIIKTAVSEVEWNYPMEYTVAFEMAIEALEKQVPKKPFSKFLCPNCRSDQIELWLYGGYQLTKLKCCPDCGKRIDWSNV